jgi:5-methylcytosine-specific restriction endonuclease McrA
MSNPKRLYDTVRWRRISKRQLTLEPLCAMCLQVGRDTPATVCDHIEPHRDDPVKFWSGPFQSLCSTCHNIKRVQENTGVLPGCDIHGLPLDEGHFWNKKGG